MSRTIKYLDGSIGKWILSSSLRDNPSNLHLLAREHLKKNNPTVLILEEVLINPEKYVNLYLDFFIPVYNIAVEVQGRQHSEYVKHFHGNPRGFLSQAKNDKLKRDWCNINNIKLITLHYNETEKWNDQLSFG